MNRLEVLHQIDRLVDGNCKGCKERIQRGSFPRADAYCLKECPIGSEIQEYGRKLALVCESERENRRSNNHLAVEAVAEADAAEAV
ncbi:zinc-finger domain-containing protein [Paenibacillus thermotolerans]|uniref:zinc-finger domain-containing protein n=1 Tax=Paenibacillus thermotolerans TaxID=3027807 RepID=UPI003CC5D758